MAGDAGRRGPADRPPAPAVHRPRRAPRPLSADGVPLHPDAGNPDRSKLQSRIWDPEVETWLNQIDVQPGWQCVDLGCGAMGILEPLSRRSMPTGRAIGVEPRPAMLLAARGFIAQAKLENVRLLDTSPERTTLPDESFHLVHERFLLSAGGSEQELLEEMLRLTRPGGIVAFQEPDLSSSNCYPDRAGWKRLRDALRVSFSAGGADLDAGSRTFGLLRRAGLEDVRIRAAALALQGAHPAKRFPLDLAGLHRERILESGALAEDALDETLAECEEIAADPETVVSFLMSQVWARKQKSRWTR